MRLTKIVAALLIGGLAASSNAEQLTIEHSFSGSAVESGEPNASGVGLIQVGSTLYGTAQNSIYAINIDGSNFHVLHTFTGLPDGQTSLAGLTVSGSTLYGTTSLGGANLVGGTVFGINTDGTGYHTVYSFSNQAGSPRTPQGGLVIDGSTLYGTLTAGGSNSRGAVFALNTDGTGFQTLHAFSGGPADGQTPVTGLTLNGSTLFGTTVFGGPNAGGTVFSINTNGTGYDILHTFTGSTFVGTGPSADLILQGTKLFGSTVGLSVGTNTATSDNGTLFSINTDGTGFQLLHSFAAGSADGNGPVGSLVLHNSHLLGVTEIGGANDRGVLFTVDTDGSNFNLMHTFGASGDGSVPHAGLTLVGDTLFGTTQTGGTNNWGTIFTILVPEPSTFALAALGIAGLVFCQWRRPANVGLMRRLSSNVGNHRSVERDSHKSV